MIMSIQKFKPYGAYHLSDLTSKPDQSWNQPIIIIENILPRTLPNEGCDFVKNILHFSLLHNYYIALENLSFLSFFFFFVLILQNQKS